MTEKRAKRILAFCCEEDISRLLDAMTSSAGYEAVCVACRACVSENPDNALAMVQSHGPNLIIANDPLRGGEMCRNVVAALAAQPSTQRIPVIVINDSMYERGVLPTGQPANVVVRFGKPFDVNAMLAKIEESIGVPRDDSVSPASGSAGSE